GGRQRADGREQKVDDDRAQDADHEEGDQPEDDRRYAIGDQRAVQPRSETRVGALRHALISRPRVSHLTSDTKANEIPSSTRPISHSASFQGSPLTVLPMSSVIWLVNVVIGAVRLVGMTGRLPMTIWTASASPAARIMPSTTAVTMPVSAAGSTTWRMV